LKIHLAVVAPPPGCGNLRPVMADTNRALGFAGSVALAVGGLSAGALPLHDPFGTFPASASCGRSR
jgi:hypothetical protein